MINCIDEIIGTYYFFFDNGTISWKFPFRTNQLSKEAFDNTEAFYRITTEKYSKINNKIALAKVTEHRVLIYDKISEKLIIQIFLNNRALNLEWSIDGNYLLITCKDYETIDMPIVKYEGLVEYCMPKTVGNIIILKIDDGTIVKDFHVEHARFAKFSRDMKSIFVGTYSEVYSVECEL